MAPGAKGTFPLRPSDAGTFWYRAWPRRANAPNRGLYGFLVVEESESVDVDRDVPLALDEWTPPSGPRVVRANAQPEATVAVRAGERVRLRLLNAAPDRYMPLRLDGQNVWVMALDGQPAEPFAARDGRIGLAPGGRADLFVDAREPGASISLLLDGPEPAPLARIVSRDEPPAKRRADPPRPLPANPLPQRIDFRAALRPEIQLDASTGSGSPAFSIRRGRPAVLALSNGLPIPAAVHIHGQAVRLLDQLDDGWKPFWLDTLIVAPDRTERVAFIPEVPGRWPIEITPLGGGSPSVRAFEVT